MSDGASLMLNGAVHFLKSILRKKFRCLRTSWNFTGSQIEKLRRKYLVAFSPPAHIALD